MEKEKVSFIDKSKAVIDIKNLEKSFGDYDVLRGIDLEVYQG